MKISKNVNLLFSITSALMLNAAMSMNSIAAEPEEFEVSHFAAIDQNERSATDYDGSYSDNRMIAVDRPAAGFWIVNAAVPSLPEFSIQVFMLSDSDVQTATGQPRGPSKRRCWWCKTAIKALAAAIVAALLSGAAAIASVAAIVAQLLGWQIVAATAFITSMAGDSADTVAEKLCKKMGQCP